MLGQSTAAPSCIFVGSFGGFVTYTNALDVAFPQMPLPSGQTRKTRWFASEMGWKFIHSLKVSSSKQCHLH